MRNFIAITDLGRPQEIPLPKGTLIQDVMYHCWAKYRCRFMAITNRTGKVKVLNACIAGKWGKVEQINTLGASLRVGENIAKLEELFYPENQEA